MANTIKFKRASGSDPSASDLAIGEPGLRTDTAELFFKKDDGTVAKVSGGGGGPNFKYLELRNAANNGAASFPGNDFTLVTAGTTTAISPSAANTLLVSVSGVIQKPNAGTSTSGITGFIIDGSRFKTATNLPAAPDFIVFQESGGIGEPSDNTVTSAKIVDGAIVNADINASAAIAGSKISPIFSANVVSNGGTNNQIILESSNGCIEISRAAGGAFIDFKNVASEDFDARIQENNGGFDITGNVNIAAGLDVTGTITGTANLNVSGNIEVNGSPPWSVASGNYANISLSGNDSSSSGFIYMGSGAATTNADFDLGRINFLNNTIITAQITGTTHTGANDDGRLVFYTKETGQTMAERMRIDSSGNVAIGSTTANALLDVNGQARFGGNKVTLDTDGSITEKISNSTTRAFLLSNTDVSADFFGGRVFQIGPDGTVLIGGSAGTNPASYSTPNIKINPSGSSFLNGGNVGIGRTPTAYGSFKVLDLAGSSGAIQKLIHTGNTVELQNYASSTVGVVGTATSHPLLFTTGDAERVRIDSSGRVLQGKSATKGSTGEVVPTFCNEIASTNPNVFEIANNGTNAANSYSALVLSRSDSTSVNGHTAVDSGDQIGEVCFIGADGSDRFNTAAAIKAFAETDFTANDCPAFLTFHTNGGSASASERMRIDSSGNVMIGGTSSSPENDSSGGNFVFAGSKLRVGRQDNPAAAFARNTGTGTIVHFNYNGSVKGQISTNGSTVSYQTSSDYRLKENEVAISDGITRLKQLKPYRFNFKETPDKLDDGFFAHEVQSVVPGAVSGMKDAVYSEDDESEGIKAGDIIPQGLDNSKLVPLLVAALQETIGRIEALEAK